MVKGQAGRGKFTDAVKKGWNKIKSTGIISKGIEKLTDMAATAAGAEGGPVAAAAVKAIGTRITAGARQRGYGNRPAGPPSQHGAGKVRKSKIIGTRRQVFSGSMTKTSGGLTKDDLMLNKRGRIVSKKKHSFGLTKGRKFLADAGYEPKKGSFKLFSKKS